MVCGDIQSLPPAHAHCPTQSPAQKLLMHSYPKSMPTELLICRSICSHFSFWIQVSLPSTGFSGRGRATAHKSPRNGKSCLQKSTHMQTILLCSLSVTALPFIPSTELILLHVPIRQRTAYILLRCTTACRQLRTPPIIAMYVNINM